jgi:hypothetical protein
LANEQTSDHTVHCGKISKVVFFQTGDFQMSEQKFFSIEAVAKYFKVKPSDIRRWIELGQLSAVNIARSGQPAIYRISVKAIADVITRKPKPTPKPIAKPKVQRILGRIQRPGWTRLGDCR